MITPSFGLTATERVLPKLALDFTTASLDSRITFTRTTGASNPATYVDSSGYITAATNNQPRFDYDPVTLVCKGLLIEESRANLLTYSEAFNTGWSTKTNVTVTTPSVSNPANGSTSDALVENGSFATHQITRTISLTAVAYTYSVFLKAGIRSWAFLGATTTTSVGAYFDLTNGVVGTVDSGFTATISPAANGFYRCSITFTATAATWTLILGGASANGTRSYGGSNGSEAIYLYGAQIEAGAFATSYIPTTSAALTRNADVAVMTGTNFSDWYNASEGTFVNWFTTEPGTTGNLQRCGLSVSDGTTSNRMTSVINTSTAMLCLVTAGGVSQAGLAPTTTNIFSGQNKVSLGYKLNNFGACINAGTVQTDTSGTVPTVTQAQIGRVENAAANFLNGWVQKCLYYSVRLTDSQLQATTK